MSEYKIPKKGAVAKLRELYQEKRDEVRKNAKKQLQEDLKKKNTSKNPQRKIAKTNQDLEPM